MGWSELSERARAQYGQVHVSDAREADVTSQSLRRAARRLGCDRPHRGVVSLPGAATSPESRIAAALLTIEKPVLASHWTAAWLHGLVATLPTTVHVLVPHGRRARVREHVQVHRTRTWQPHHEHEIRDLAVTSGGRTLGDLAGELATARLRAWCIDLVHRGDTTWDELRTIPGDLGRLPGVGKLERVVAQTAAEDPESILDFELRRKLRSAGLHPDRGALKVEFAGKTQRIDIAWQRFKVGIEADSLTFHGDRASLQRDIRRHNANRPSDWIVLRAGWAEVEEEAAWAEFVAVLRAVLRERGAPV